MGGIEAEAALLGQPISMLIPDVVGFGFRLHGELPEGAWLPNRVTKTFLAHRRHAGVGRFRLHDLRHFMATQMLNAGVPVPTVSERLGHARASTTLNIYGHCVPGSDRAADEFICTLIAPER